MVIHAVSLIATSKPQVAFASTLWVSHDVGRQCSNPTQANPILPANATLGQKARLFCYDVMRGIQHRMESRLAKQKRTEASRSYLEQWLSSHRSDIKPWQIDTFLSVINALKPPQGQPLNLNVQKMAYCSHIEIADGQDHLLDLRSIPPLATQPIHTTSWSADPDENP